jgi:hypothetical protein
MVRSRVFRSMGEIRYLGLDQYLVCKGTTAAEALLSDVQKRLGNACAETVKRWSTVSLLRWLRGPSSRPTSASACIIKPSAAV